jgi:hypothetical protein
VLVVGDVGSTIRVVETATNGGGTATATSAQTATVTAGSLTLAVAAYDADGGGPSTTATSLGTVLPGSSATSEVRATVTTTNPNGYTLALDDPDGNGAAYKAAAPAATVPWAGLGTVAAPAAWSGTGIGVSAFGGASTPARWCTGGAANCTSTTDVDLLWAALTASPQVVSSKASAAAGGDTTRLPVRASIAAGQAAGGYSGTLELTATAIP